MAKINHTENYFEIEFQLPGFKKEDIDVDIAGNNLRVSAKKELEKDVEKEGFMHKEKSSEDFHYETTIPDVKPGSEEINFEGDTLKIRVEKANYRKNLNVLINRNSRNI